LRAQRGNLVSLSYMSDMHSYEGCFVVPPRNDKFHERLGKTCPRVIFPAYNYPTFARMKTKLDINSWARKEHFNFFKNFDEPIYGVCVRIDCTIAYKAAKERGVSFYLYTLYKAMLAAQMIESFRYRIEGGDVIIYDHIHAASTVPRSNGTFGFSYIFYNPSFDDFIEAAKKEVERVQSSTILDKASRWDLIRFSSLPWIDFTSISHARMFSFEDSAPSISFGKMTEADGKRTMPMSVHVHHALVDGIHVGQYIDCFQELMNKGI